MNIVLLLLAAVAAVAGLWGGLVRIGVPLPASTFADTHGPLMVCGLFGTVISLERAIALEQRWALAAPLAFGLGGLCILLGSAGTAAVLFLAGSLVLVVASLVVFVLQRALFTFGLVIGAACLAGGDALWMTTGDARASAGLWIAFFVGTIAAERLELSRAIESTGVSRGVFALLLLLLASGAALGIDGLSGRLLLGSALTGLAVWLSRYDIARRVVHRPGATRFFAFGMLAGYFWLAVSGGLIVFGSDLAFAYDLQLHTVFLGFVLSMLMAHALIILPAVVGMRLTYSRSFYFPLALLHFSLLLRLLGGTIGPFELRTLSGPVTVVSLATFVILIVGTRVFAVKRKKIARVPSA